MTTTKNTRRTLTIRNGGNTLILWLPQSATSSDHARLVRIARRHGNSCEATFGPDSDLPDQSVEQLADTLRS